MQKVLDFFKSEFPNDAMDIRDCVDLLNQCLVSTVENINLSAAKAFAQREFDKMNVLSECVKNIDELQNKLESYSSLLDLDENVEMDIITKEDEESIERKIPNYSEYNVDSNIPYSLYDDFTHKRPAAFYLFDERIDANDWKEILVKTCEVLARKDLEKFSAFINDKSMSGKKVVYFSKSSNGMRAPRKVIGTDIFVMTNMSANQVRNVIERMLKRYGIKINEYKIYLKADYTAFHA